MILIYSLWLFLYATLLLRDRKKFLVSLPIFLLVLDSGFSFMGPNSLITFAKAGTLLFFILINIKIFQQHIKYNTAAVLFIGYCLLLIFFSNELPVSLKNSSKALPPLFYLFFGIAYFKQQEDFLSLLRNTIYLIFVASVFGLAGYIFDVGREFSYGDDITAGSVGLLQGGNYYPVAISITLVAWLFVDDHFKISVFKRAFLISVSALTYLLILLTMRRTSIILPLLGIVTIMLTTRKSLGKISLLIASLGILLFLSWPLYGDLLVKRYTIRAEMGRFEEDFYETENRFIETTQILKETFSLNNIPHSLFGSNVFAGGWENGIVRRMYHTDHGQIMATSGLVGFSIYVGIFFSFFRRFFRYRRFYNISSNIRNLNSLFLAIILITIAVGFNGSIFIVTFRTTAFLLIGALIGRISNEIDSLRVSGRGQNVFA